MKHPIMHNHSRRKVLTFITLLITMAFIGGACQTQPVANGNSASANTANNANAPASSGYIDLVGKWEGQSQGQPSTLVITSHMSDSFTGTKTVGETQVAIAGMIDLSTRQITIRETNLVKGSGYSLGAGTGVIAPSGRQMTGEWKAKGSASQFSYSK